MASGGGFDLRLAGRVAAAALLFAATSAAADSPDAPPSPTPEHDVVVTGQAPRAARERQLHAFVQRVPTLNNGENLARWVAPACPVVAGMTEEQGEYVLLRLFQVARAAGAPVIEDGRCEANVYIIATADPEGLLKAWALRSPAIFASTPAPVASDLERTSRPVRVWYNAHVDRQTTNGNSPFAVLPGKEGLPVIPHAIDTRLHSNAPYALGSAFIVIDSPRVAGVKVGALADYIAMAALTQLQPDAENGDAPSILSLFAAREGSDPPDGLTAWDTAFLHALYHTSLEDLHQPATIAIRMNEELSRGRAGR
jgi:hypothetical protein